MSKGSDQFALTLREFGIFSLLVKGMSFKMITDSCKGTWSLLIVSLRNRTGFQII